MCTPGATRTPVSCDPYQGFGLPLKPAHQFTLRNDLGQSSRLDEEGSPVPYFWIVSQTGTPAFTVLFFAAGAGVAVVYTAQSAVLGDPNERLG